MSASGVTEKKVTEESAPIMTELTRKEKCHLDTHLAPFGANSASLLDLMSDTAAVLAGGAVVHLLSDSDYPLSAESDLDFLIYDPSILELERSVEKCEKSPEYYEKLAHKTAFEKFVLQRFIKTFTTFERESCAMVKGASDERLDGYPSVKGTTMKDYQDFTGEFLTKCGAVIHVRWLFNKTTKRTINVIFTNQPVWSVIQGFDLPLCRAALYGWGKLSLQCDPIARQDLADRKLTTCPAFETDRTARRIAKYCSRYGMTLRTAKKQSSDVARLSAVIDETENPKLKAALRAIVAIFE